MLVVGINGSPNKDGNTADLIRLALKETEKRGAETKEIYLQEALDAVDNPYCTVCSPRCQGQCYQNTPLEALYDTISKADALLLGSPVYFGTVSAQLKGFWDKTRKLRGEKALLNTVGGAITVGNARFGGQETTSRALYDLMLVQGMIIVGDGYEEDDAGHHGAFAQRPALEDEFAKKRTIILAKRIVQVAEATKSIRK